MKKTRKRKTGIKRVWDRFLKKRQDGRCQVGIPERSSIKISWRERR